jgi:uncharacterized membrane protein HdeD (DUF308 family)
MENFGTKNGWITALKGLLSLGLGILIVSNTSTALLLIATYFGIFAIIGGAGVLIYAFWNQKKGIKSTFWLFEGSFNILVGLIIVFYPEISISIFLAFFGIWAIIIALIQFLTYRQYRDLKMNSGLILFNAIISLAVGITLLFNPFESAKIIALFIGIYAIIYGLFSIYAAYRIARKPKDIS